MLASILEVVLIDYDLVDANPLRGILKRKRFPTEATRPKDPRVRFLEPEEFRRVLTHLGGTPKVRDAAVFAALTGLRWGLWTAWEAARTGSATTLWGTSRCMSGSLSDNDQFRGFCSSTNRPQVYFPPEKDIDGSMTSVEEDDRRAVSRMFRFIFDVVEQLSPGFQVVSPSTPILTSLGIRTPSPNDGAARKAGS